MRNLLLILLLVALPAWADSLAPKLDIGKGGQCVEDPAFMRSNHMRLIVHQRDETVRKGIRGSKYSLANCVDCHASKDNNSVLGSNRNFCQGCHVYAAVKIDCFECHSSRRKVAPTALASNEAAASKNAATEVVK
jgi:cytochrome c553